LLPGRACDKTLVLGRASNRIAREGLASKTLGKNSNIYATNHSATATQPAAQENKAWPERSYTHDATGCKMVTDSQGPWYLSLTMQNGGRLKAPPYAADQLDWPNTALPPAEINLPRGSPEALALGFGEKTETTTPCCGSTSLAQYGAAPGRDQSPQRQHSSISLKVRDQESIVVWA